MDQFVIGIIGMGDMGQLYAKRLSQGGWKVHACDREQNFSQLQTDLASHTGIVVLQNGHEVACTSDYILYNIEASKIESVVRDYGKSTKLGAIVGGQTSCKTPEIKAFERHLPNHCEIVSLHSLHGPSTDPQGQPLAIVPHRASLQSVSKVQEVIACLRSQTTIMTALEHDSITANTQVLMSAIFLSIVLAFKFHGRLPKIYYVRQKERADLQVDELYRLVFRIFAQKWHVYAGLSLFNPFSETYLAHYATSVRILTALVMEGQFDKLRERVQTTAAALNAKRRQRPEKKTRTSTHSKDIAAAARGESGSKRPNGAEVAPAPLAPLPSMLLIAILATGDMWVALNVNPWEHLHCATPQYRDWLRIVSELYSALQPSTLDATLATLLIENHHEAVAPGYHLARAMETWLAYVQEQDFVAFERTFEDTGRWLSRHDLPRTTVGDHATGRRQDSVLKI